MRIRSDIVNVFDELSGFNGPIIVNDKEYKDIETAKLCFEKYVGAILIKINPEVKGGRFKVITKHYMTQAASPEFDFMSKFNNNIPMPRSEMVGYKLAETPGMIRMSLTTEDGKCKWEGWIIKSAIIFEEELKY